MATKKLTTTDALVAYMQDEGLNEIVLDGVDPNPVRPEASATPDEVAFTWWSYAGAYRVPYRFRAHGVRAWRLEGAIGDRAISVVRADGPGIRVVMEVPGPLTMDCAALEVARGRKQKLPRTRRPFAEYVYFRASLTGSISVDDVLAALGAPADARAFSGAHELSPGDRRMREAAMERPPVRVVVAGTTWFVVTWPTTRAANRLLYVLRKDAPDDAWHRAAELPHHLASAHVEAAHSFEGTAADWMKEIGRRRLRGAPPSPG